MLLTAGTRSLPEGFKLFAIIHTITTSHAVITRITREVIEDCAADNIVHLELRTTPKVSKAASLQQPWRAPTSFC